MTDVPPGDARPGEEPDEDERFDDDALADALAAEVAAYTSPVATTPTGESAETGDSAVFSEEDILGEGSTLEAIERLENELRRLTGEPPPSGERVFPRAYEPFSPTPPEGTAITRDESHAVPPIGEESAAEESATEPSATGEFVTEGSPQATEPEPRVPEDTVPEGVDPQDVDPGDVNPEQPAAEAPPPPFAPPVLAPPPLVEPPSAPVDFSTLPPPVGIPPAALPPYEPGPPPMAQPVDTETDTEADTEAQASDNAVDAHADPADDPAPADDAEPAADRGTELDAESDDDDETDRAAIPVDGTGAALVAPPPPTTARARHAGEQGVLGDGPLRHPAFQVETAGPEPTALDLRAGRASRLFWLWFAANSSVLSLAVGAGLFTSGMSLRQAIVATLAGVAISFLPLGLGTLAGKWSGQPTMVVSRASFGVVGNVLPAALALVSRVFWGGALLWLLSASISRILVEAGLDAGLGETVWTVVGLVVGFAIATVVAVFGYGLIARVQLVLSIATGVLIIGVVALTFPRVDLRAALTMGDGPWLLVVGGAVLVFSFVGLAWVHSSSDVARYQRRDGSGGSSMLWATFGATLPAFILVAWGAVLAASDPEIAEGLAGAPLETLAGLLPAWYPAPLLAVAALGLLSGTVLAIYSGGFALQSLGVAARRSVTTSIAAVIVLILALVLVLLVPDTRALLRDAATTIAVPVAAWAGIFAAEMMIRNRPFHVASLLARGGRYADIRWINVVALVVISAVGFGFTSASLPGLGWQGFLFPLFGVAVDDPLATSDIGVFAALVLGLIVALVSAMPAIRRQESVPAHS
jgi:purine-cytosine permease-like protein